MRTFLFFLCGFGFQLLNAQVLLEADGLGDTYELITSVLAPGNNPIETPDCSHPSFGNHIDEVFEVYAGNRAIRIWTGGPN